MATSARSSMRSQASGRADARPSPSCRTTGSWRTRRMLQPNSAFKQAGLLAGERAAARSPRGAPTSTPAAAPGYVYVKDAADRAARAAAADGDEAAIRPTASARSGPARDAGRDAARIRTRRSGSTWSTASTPAAATMCWCKPSRQQGRPRLRSGSPGPARVVHPGRTGRAAARQRRRDQDDADRADAGGDPRRAAGA